MLLDVKGLSCFYKTEDGEFAAVKDLSFDLRKKEALGLIGESGCGKSTVAWSLLGMLGDLGGHAHGSFNFKGTDFDLHRADSWQKLRWREIAIVPQTAMNSFNPVYTVGQSLTELIQHYLPDLPEKVREDKARDMLAGVELPHQTFHSYPHQLSGGMRQRAALAKALVCSPSLLILDEATTGLDVITEGNILKTVMDLKEAYSMSLLLVTHDLRLVGNICDRYVVLQDGRRQDPESPYARKLFAAMPAVGSRKKPSSGETETAPVLEVEQLAKSFKKPGTGQTFQVLDQVSFSLYPGKITGLVGASGSGKTTLVNILFYLLQPGGGTFRYNGVSTSLSKNAAKGLRGRMSLVRQDPFDSLPPHQKIGTIVAEPLRINGLSQGRKADLAKVSQVLTEVGLDPGTYLERYPHQLSGGQNQRVAIARALVTGPAVLALDEPTSMLDATIKNDILQLIAQQAKTKNIAVLLVTHDLAAASAICDDLLVLQAGKLVEKGHLEYLLAASNNRYFRRLLLAATDLKAYWEYTEPAAAQSEQQNPY